jgi:hypothetical protein
LGETTVEAKTNAINDNDTINHVVDDDGKMVLRRLLLSSSSLSSSTMDIVSIVVLFLLPSRIRYILLISTRTATS